ncbi:hypothetical protein AUI06_09935 [archaeon 13_2_20CM_2_52_21]|nr:MAG: hypothetical protein AUI06_09935 [archaeon 13_2_20CM_2_52_21]
MDLRYETTHANLNGASSFQYGLTGSVQRIATSDIWISFCRCSVSIARWSNILDHSIHSQVRNNSFVHFTSVTE